MPQQETKIPNHSSAKLSDLDLEMAIHVPPGGNWKNIPNSVPSKRLESIRESYAAGKGSRSTYYGRLSPDAPSYTINTYFNRPGNGCHLHYDFEGGQHRVISQREAARLQSFPDNFEFLGNSQTAINNQIGNAVPPLLAFQIARSLPWKGNLVDLFSGAGGISLGFKWAGWESIVANDVNIPSLETYSRHIHQKTIAGDIRDNSVFHDIVEEVRTISSKYPLFLVGGPPCQGFSTAGNKRSMDDPRNHLFKQFVEAIKILEPTGFIFENVTGLLNMQGGRVFEMIRSELQSVSKIQLQVWKLQAEQYGIPQRRTRVFIVGINDEKQISFPKPITTFGKQKSLFEDLAPAITVSEALEDLPKLKNGEDGSTLNYRHEHKSVYQAFMRSEIDVIEYLRQITQRKSVEL